MTFPKAKLVFILIIIGLLFLFLIIRGILTLGRISADVLSQTDDLEAIDETLY